ncbi:MAG: cobyric acid synthase [Geobacteraceae bacterium]|nr:cobyric acid synthase [Geobacteraceae bacterium]
MSKLYVVGLGPGNLKNMTFEAREAIESADTVVGYKTYLDLIKPLLKGKEVVSSGMTKEVERCREALRLAAEGRTVALVSSGDAGVYGMAGLVLELSPPDEVEVVIVPGVSAVQAAAAVLGAPLMHDFAVISLSDLLTPWELIEKRLPAAAAADFVVALYNPRSKGRVRHIPRAWELLLACRSPQTPVGIVRNACREGEEKILSTLAGMPLDSIDMFSLVIVGNSSTYVDEQGRMVTPRGYETGTRNKVRGSGKDTHLDDPQSSTLDPLSSIPVPQSCLSRAVMFVGTGSDVGKSILAAGFCRILSKRGISVAPFKSQNMALNSYATPEGGEIGRAQAVQAQGCRIPPHTDMNPVLLKPNSDTGSQIIVQGKVVGNMVVQEYNAYKPEAFRKVEESFRRLSGKHRFVVIEGAGSIAEINLKAHDIANLRIAKMADCPCILVADIDRGGVFAQIVGTWELLQPDERELVKGIVINKFRGDPSLLTSGIEFVEKRTGVPVLGVVPYFSHFRIPEEDSVALEKRRSEARGKKSEEGTIRIGVLDFPHISNYTDFDPLESEPDVDLRYSESSSELDGLDVLILPGSKSTISDLQFLQQQGLIERIRNFEGLIVGICGGYQMLGTRILDPDGIESSVVEAEGLGILDVETVLLPEKETHQAEGRLLSAAMRIAPNGGDTVSGYEIHMGSTTLGPTAKPFVQLLRRSGSEVAILDGAVSADARVFGTYLHGIFDNHEFRTAFLNRLRRAKSLPVVSAESRVEDPFDLLAEHLEQHLDMEKLFRICRIEECPA